MAMNRCDLDQITIKRIRWDGDWFEHCSEGWSKDCWEGWKGFVSAFNLSNINIKQLCIWYYLDDPN